jgi:hypothetical protein
VNLYINAMHKFTGFEVEPGEHGGIAVSEPRNVTENARTLASLPLDAGGARPNARRA